MDFPPRGCDVNDIAGKYTEVQSQVSAVPVPPDEGGTAISGMDAEDKSVHPLRCISGHHAGAYGRFPTTYPLRGPNDSFAHAERKRKPRYNRFTPVITGFSLSTAVPGVCSVGTALFCRHYNRFLAVCQIIQLPPVRFKDCPVM